jgi:8-oxo-dGTP pyrophosphatase MutT (NUDIX family)
VSEPGSDENDTAQDDKQLARLTGEARERGHANIRPKDAATLMILDHSGATPKILMGRRHPGHKFMPNKFVFPGGRIEPCDRQMPVAGVLDRHVEDRLMRRVTRPSIAKARALALAAIRETFEETGLLLGTKEFGAPQAPAGSPWEAFAAHGVHPTLEGMHFIARATTPPQRPRRFDTRFFVCQRTSVAHTVEGMVGENSELIDLAWVTLAETADMELPVITRVVLEELGHALEAGFSPHRPVPYYLEKNRKFIREDI